MEELKNRIRSIPDFPRKGILFRDITTLIKDGGAFRKAVDSMLDVISGENIEAVASIEARGFLLGGVLAYRLGTGIVPVRKKGKLPHETFEVSYDLEYGRDTLEVHRDAFEKNQRVLLVDDLLATGGTAAASVELIEKSGAKVAAAAFLVELTDLGGAKKLAGRTVYSLIRY